MFYLLFQLFNFPVHLPTSSHILVYYYTKWLSYSTAIRHTHLGVQYPCLGITS